MVRSYMTFSFDFK